MFKPQKFLHWYTKEHWTSIAFIFLYPRSEENIKTNHHQTFQMHFYFIWSFMNSIILRVSAKYTVLCIYWSQLGKIENIRNILISLKEVKQKVRITVTEEFAIYGNESGKKYNSAPLSNKSQQSDFEWIPHCRGIQCVNCKLSLTNPNTSNGIKISTSFFLGGGGSLRDDVILDQCPLKV